jgi:hypothetical protein
MVNKLEKGRTAPKIASQHHKKDEKNEYARNAYLNIKMPHIKSGIGYKAGDKNSSSSPKPIFNMRKSKTLRLLTMLLMLIRMSLIFLICHTMILKLLMF